MPEQKVLLQELLPLITARLSAGESFRFNPGGVSMLPMLRPGTDTVVLSPLPQKLKKYDLPLYRRSSGQFVLHRVIRVGETYTCIGDNQFRKEPGLTHEQMIGLVTAFVRNGKEHSVTETGYRLYCRLWHYSRGIRLFWRRGKGYLKRKLSRQG